MMAPTCQTSCRATFRTRLAARKAAFRPTRSQLVVCQASRDSVTQPWSLSSMAASVALALLVTAAPAQATGLESVDILSNLEAIKTPDDYRAGAAKEAQKLKDVDENFQNSDTLKKLLEKSAANKDKNKKAILDKYCYRQAEIGVGDCGGLRLIPGMTESGKQRTPDWLSDLLGVERAPAEDPSKPTLKSLFGGELPE